MYAQNVQGTITYPVLVFCRKEFLEAIAKSWVDSSAHKDGFAAAAGIDLKRLRQFASIHDIQENVAIATKMGTASQEWIHKVSTPYFPFCNFDADNGLTFDALYDNRVDGLVKKEATEYVLGSTQNAISDLTGNPVEECCGFLAKGDYLFVGIEPGFVPLVVDKEFEREFLTNCLELCRNTMQSPAINASPLYKRFIFTNLIV